MPGKNLVVDACVARSAGSKTEAPQSTHSRDALEAIREYSQHKLAFNSALSEEWREHAGRFATSLLSYLVQKRRIVYVPDDAFVAVMNTCAHTFPDGEERTAFEKDAHVVAAALAADRILISNEVRLRDQLTQLSPAHERIKEITWANPSLEGANCADWLRQGAGSTPDRYIAGPATLP